MQRWEYLHVRISMDASGHWQYFGQDGAMHPLDLTQFGAQGWEMVGAHPQVETMPSVGGRVAQIVQTAVAWLYFKRPIED